MASLPEHDKVLASLSEAVRTFMRDFAELNRLTTKEETSPRMIAFAIMMALSEINSTPPVTSYCLQDIPAYLMITAATIAVLNSVVLLKTRNKLQFSDGGVAISRENPELLMSLAQLLRSTFDRKLQQWKIFQNINSAMGGGVHSEYWLLQGGFW